MIDYPENKGRPSLMSRSLVLIGLCLFAGSLLGPAVAEFLPADGFTIGSTRDGFFRVVPAQERSVDLQLVFMFIGLVLFCAGMILRRRG